MTKDDWRSELPRTRDVARGTGLFSGWTLIVGIAAIAVAYLLGWFVWGILVGTSDIKGKGDAIKTKNSATNRIAAQERFEDGHAEILAADKRIDIFFAAAKRQPDSQVAQTNLTGAYAYCTQVVKDYNADARKYTARDFRAIDLPLKIDDQDPATDCKETTTP